MKKYIFGALFATFTFLILPPSAHAALPAFTPGNFVQVTTAFSGGLYVHSSCNVTSSVINHRISGDSGYVLSGNTTTCGGGYTWIKVRWQKADGAQYEGWSAIADLSNVAWVSLVSTAPCKTPNSFSSGTRVQVYGPSVAYVRSEPVTLSKNTQEAPVGSLGTIQSGGSVCALGMPAANGPGQLLWANFWKVKFDDSSIGTGRVGEQVLYDIGTLKAQFISETNVPPSMMTPGQTENYITGYAEGYAARKAEEAK